jgi:ABC-type transporter MlaC component
LEALSAQLSRRVIVLLGLAWPSAVRAAAIDPASRIAVFLRAVDSLSAQAGLSDAALMQAFRPIAAEHLDVAAMARAALRDQLRTINGADLADYVDAYATHLARAFVLGVRRTGGSVSRVVGQRRLQNGTPVVISRIRAGARERDVTWIFCGAESRRVCDVETDGVIASARQRAIFARVFSEEGLETLIARLRSGRLAVLD